MPIRRGFFGGAINLLPEVTINAATSVTESRATFNATINGNLANTTIVFHYSTASNFSSFTSVAGSGSGTGSFSSSATVAGLTKATVLDAAATTYYVRAVVTSSIGSVTSGTTSFATWTLRQVVSATSSSFTVPTVAGVNPANIPVLVLIGGGGGGAYGGGGGAGGLVVRSNVPFTGPNGTLSWSCGGGAGPGGTGGGNGGSGTSSTLSGINFNAVSAGGGEGGYYLGRGGNLGAGDGPAYTGGSVHVINNKGTLNYWGGGGAGMDGNGGNAVLNAAGAGGPGNGFWGNGGGGGGVKNANGSQVGANAAVYNIGRGGQGGANNATGSDRAATSGGTGIVVFQYYGP
jgi:hypothetical protein